MMPHAVQVVPPSTVRKRPSLVPANIVEGDFWVNGKASHVAEIGSNAEIVRHTGESSVYRRPGRTAVFGAEQAFCRGSVQGGRMDGINGKNGDTAIIHRKLFPGVSICRL